jgi:hypothetical protein
VIVDRALVCLGSALLLLVAACAPESSIAELDEELTARREPPDRRRHLRSGLPGGRARRHEEERLGRRRVLGRDDRAEGRAHRWALRARLRRLAREGALRRRAGPELERRRHLRLDQRRSVRRSEPARRGARLPRRPITLPSYPEVASQRVAWGTKVRNIGRIDDGVTSHTALFLGPSVAAQNGASVGFPLSYRSAETIQSGDSGGPVVCPGPRRTRSSPSTRAPAAASRCSRASTSCTPGSRAASTRWRTRRPPSPAPAAPPRPILVSGIDYAGTCQGSKVVWCENGALKSVSCGTKKTCGWSAGNGYYDCL